MQESERIRKISGLSDEMFRMMGEMWYGIIGSVITESMTKVVESFSIDDRLDKMMVQWERDRGKALVRSRRNQLGQRKRYKHGRTYRTK